MKNEQAEIFCLNPQYSTTRLVTKKSLEIENDSCSEERTKGVLSHDLKRRGEGGLRRKGYFKVCTAEKPLVSIITPVYNGSQYVDKIIESVLGQTYDNVEYIIIDGGSTDDTLTIIKRYEDAIDYWVSEPDEGQAAAINKGFAIAQSDIFG